MTSPDGVSEARDFVTAVAWGEHDRVWSLLSTGGQALVLEIAGRRGMDTELVKRLGAGGADAAERATFLVDLVNGLRADLAGTDLDDVDYEAATVAPRDDQPVVSNERTFVVVVEPPAEALAALGGSALPVATVELEVEAGAWRVCRLVPQRRR